MNQTPATVCIATLGNQPQVVTLALDALLARGAPISEVIVVHLSGRQPRYRAALECLQREFAGDCYAGRPCRYRPHPVSIGARIVDDLCDEDGTDAVFNTFHTLLQRLKQQGSTIHLCLTGGRRLLGMLALSAALLYFDQADRIWHLYSSDSVCERTHCGLVLHLPDCPDIHLVRLPLVPWGQLFPVLRPPASADASAVVEMQSYALGSGERARCKQVWDRLTIRQRDVLRKLAQGLTPQEVAERLSITLATVNTHKTTIFQESYIAWNLPHNTRLDYHWLREKFGPFLAT